MKNRLLLPVFGYLLLMSSFVQADETAVTQSAEEERQLAEEELSKLEQTVGEAANESASQSDSNEASSKPWLPAAKEFDWVQLVSGEWLKGEIKSMYNDSLEFDSDQLDLLSIDWEDVKYLKSYRPSSVNIENHLPVTGDLQISEDRITISRGDKVQEFNRTELISLTPSGDREIDLWSIDLSLGVNYRQGNTEQFDYTARLNAKRRTAKTRFVLDYIGNTSKTGTDDDGLTQTVNNHRVNASHNIYATRYFFYQPIFAEYYRDPFQNIDQKLLAGVGLGYTLIDNGRYEWNVTGGPAYLSTRFISVLPDEEREVDAAAIVFGTDLDAEISSTLDFIFKYNIQGASDESGGYNHHMIASFENELTGRLDFDISLIWDRISQPVEDDTGVAPEPDDYRLVVGLSYTY